MTVKVKVPSKTSKSVHTVTVTKSGARIKVKFCTCRGFRRWKHCRHQPIGIKKAMPKFSAGVK